MEKKAKMYSNGIVKVRIGLNPCKTPAQREGSGGILLVLPCGSGDSLENPNFVTWCSFPATLCWPSPRIWAEAEQDQAMSQSVKVERL